MLNTIKKSILKNRSKIRDNFENLPIVSVSRSNKNLVAQLLDYTTKKIIFTATTYKLNGGTKTEKSSELANQFAKFLAQNKISKVIFNRNGKIYHGRIAAFAETLRKNKIDI